MSDAYAARLVFGLDEPLIVCGNVVVSVLSLRRKSFVSHVGAGQGFQLTLQRSPQFIIIERVAIKCRCHVA